MMKTLSFIWVKLAIATSNLQVLTGFYMMRTLVVKGLMNSENLWRLFNLMILFNEILLNVVWLYLHVTQIHLIPL